MVNEFKIIIELCEVYFPNFKFKHHNQPIEL